MGKRMTFHPTSIKAADETEDTRVADLSNELKDDFNYLLDGFERLDRKGATSETLQIMNEVYQAIDNAINKIAELTDETASDVPVESTTEINAATLEDLKYSVENRIEDLEGITSI